MFDVTDGAGGWLLIEGGITVFPGEAAAGANFWTTGFQRGVIRTVSWTTTVSCTLLEPVVSESIKESDCRFVVARKKPPGTETGCDEKGSSTLLMEL